MSYFNLFEFNNFLLGILEFLVWPLIPLIKAICVWGVCGSISLQELLPSSGLECIATTCRGRGTEVGAMDAVLQLVDDFAIGFKPTTLVLCPAVQ